jgi:hypothetical protein
LTATKAAVLAVVLACADTVADTEQDPESLAVWFAEEDSVEDIVTFT